MKKSHIFASLILLSSLLLTACSNAPKVDIKGEMDKRPEIKVTWEGETNLPGINGNFCTDVLCMDSGNPDWSAMKSVQYTNGTDLTVTVNTTNTIKDLSVSLKNQDGNTIQNNVPHTDNGDKTYTVTDPFIKTGDVILSVKVTFVEGGYGQSFFPITVE